METATERNPEKKSNINLNFYTPSKFDLCPMPRLNVRRTFFHPLLTLVPVSPTAHGVLLKKFEFLFRKGILFNLFDLLHNNVLSTPKGCASINNFLCQFEFFPTIEHRLDSAVYAKPQKASSSMKKKSATRRRRIVKVFTFKFEFSRFAGALLLRQSQLFYFFVFTSSTGVVSSPMRETVCRELSAQQVFTDELRKKLR